MLADEFIHVGPVMAQNGNFGQANMNEDAWFGALVAQGIGAYGYCLRKRHAERGQRRMRFLGFAGSPQSFERNMRMIKFGCLALVIWSAIVFCRAIRLEDLSAIGKIVVCCADVLISASLLRVYWNDPI